METGFHRAQGKSPNKDNPKGGKSNIKAELSKTKEQTRNPGTRAQGTTLSMSNKGCDKN